MPAILDPRQNEAAWIEDRKQRITGTDAAAIVGLHPYRTALDVYLDKLGLAPERPMTEAMAWGLRLEGPILDAYAERTGREIVDTQRYEHHPARPWQAATVDAVTRCGRLVEVKTIGIRSGQLDELGEPGTDEVPTSWLIQVQHQLAVTGHDLADVAALVGGQELRLYHLERNDKLIAKLTDAQARFREEHLLTETPPDPARASDADAYQWLYPDREGGILWSDNRVLELLSLYEQLGESARHAERRRKEVKAELLAHLGPHERATTTDGRTVECKKRYRAGYTVEPCDYLDFRVRTTPGNTR